MKKCFTLLLLICSLYLPASAQKKYTYFLKESGQYLPRIDSADYVRIVTRQKKDAKLYLVEEFYRNGIKKSVGYSSTVNPPQYEGQYISFFEDGTKKYITEFVAGKVKDSVYTYFPNGSLYTVMTYGPASEDYRKYIQTVKDSTGNILVKDGNGKAVFYDSNFSSIIEEGRIKNGLYDGEWSGELRTTDTLKYKEIYANGKFVSGESIDNKGQAYHYTELEVQPSFPGGTREFYKALSNNIRYPRNMIMRGVQGIVNVGFVISTTGEIIDIKINNEGFVHPELAAEAIRVVKLGKGWVPGVQKGRKVNVAYSAPLSFMMDR